VQSKASWATTLDNSTQNSRLQVPKVAIAVWLHISCSVGYKRWLLLGWCRLPC